MLRKTTRLITAATAAALLTAAMPASAELLFPSLVQRTGAYAANGAPIADAYADYFTLLNERDGGIGGVRARVLECETGYDTARGIACYESTKTKGALVYQPMSTGAAYRLLSKVRADKIPMFTMGYGRASAANGKVFPWVFNFPATYWDAASVMVSHMLDEQNGNLRGKKIALLHHDSAYGREPVHTLSTLARKHGFTLTLLPADRRVEKSHWQKLLRNNPEYVLLWGWGEMNRAAIQQAAAGGFPMRNLIGVWSSASETDVLPAGEGAHGYKVVSFHAAGDDFPVYKDLNKYVVKRGLAAGGGKHLGTMLYNRSLYSAILTAEAAATAQRIHRVKNITPEQMRDGMEALQLDRARMQELGIPNFAPEFQITCSAHAAPGLAAILQWNARAKTWNRITDFQSADREVVDALIEKDSTAYARENGITPREC